MILSSRKLPKGLAIASQSPEFWRRLAPELTISDAQPTTAIRPAMDQSAKNRMRLINEGYVHLRQPGMDAPIDVIASAMDRIVTAGLPAAFVGVYDEVWSMIAQMNGVIDGLFDGQSAMVPNFWANRLEAGDTGLTAGRKRPGQGVFSNGMPKSVTVWMPVTKATPENGCVYTVPADQDRNYGRHTTERADSSLPAIRALPAEAGDVLIWTGEAYVWQARPSRHAENGPLLSLTWEFQSRTISPLEGLLVEGFPYVPFETRLGLLAAQMPRHSSELGAHPVWRAVQQTLANRFPIQAPV